MLNLKVVKRLAVITVMSIGLSACTSSPAEEETERLPDRSPQAQYQKAKAALNSAMYNNAISILSQLESRYPFGPLTRQIQLDLMFAYYKSGQFEQALPAIDRFRNLNPNHPQLDYVAYLRGLVNMESGINNFQNFFGVEDADKDMSSTRDAFNDFKMLIERYPNSKYVADSKTKMVYLLDKLARHEVVIAEYYMRRQAYVAALNRCKYVVEYYQHSNSVKPALEIMVKAYDALGLEEMKADTQKVLAQNAS